MKCKKQVRIYCETWLLYEEISLFERIKVGEVKHYSSLLEKSTERPLVVASECGIRIVICCFEIEDYP